MWLTVLPLKSKHFWMVSGLDIFCWQSFPWKDCQQIAVVVYHSTFNISCPKGGFTIIRHKEIRDLTAEVWDEICTNLNVEPNLTALTGEQFLKLSKITTDEARADVSARGFWVKGHTSYCDVKVVNPLAKCYLNQSLVSEHKPNENEKTRQYNQRILHLVLIFIYYYFFFYIFMKIKVT